MRLPQRSIADTYDLMDPSSDDEVTSAATSRTRAAKDLRRSIFSMNPSNSNAAYVDLDDDDDDPDYSPDHALAKRLQDEEYADASVEDLKQDNARATRSSLHLSTNPTPALTPSSASSGLSTRRAREESSSVELGPPAKRARGMASTPSEPGLNTAEGAVARPTPSIGSVRSRPSARGRPRATRPARRSGNTSFIPAAQLLQYGNNPRPPPSISDTTDQSSEAGTPDDNSVIILSSDTPDTPDTAAAPTAPAEEELDRQLQQATRRRRGFRTRQSAKAAETFRSTLEKNHPEIRAIWKDLEKKPLIRPAPAPQPTTIHRQMKPFQLEGLAWMKEMEASEHKGGVLGDEMGLGKTIQAVSLIMSDFPAGKPSLVLVPPVALLQWVSEIDSYTDKALKTFVFHGTNQNTKSIKLHELRKYDVIMMSYNSLEAMYRRETKGLSKKKKNDDSTIEVHKTPSVMHKIEFHRVILDEAHGIKVSPLNA